jgi:ketose-bisphosphate aldolase
MTVVKLSEILGQALRRGYAVGYFEAWDQYSLEAVLGAAEAAGSPAILGFGAAVTNLAWLEAGGIEQLAGLARGLAERAAVPVAVLFNEAQSPAHAQRGLAAGCNCVMLDTSHLPWDENVAVTRAMVEAARTAGAEVEAELGHLPNAAGPDRAAGELTDPAEAVRFVELTGVSALAVSVGNVHLLSDGEARLDLARLARLRQAAGVPLVLHGGTGIPAGAIASAIARGVAKVNYGTRLKQVFLAGVREAVANLPEALNVHAYVGSRDETDLLVAGQRRMQSLLGELIRVYGSAGQARAESEG